MKKSEMIDILKLDITDTEGMSLEDRASFILASMEARGMVSWYLNEYGRLETGWESEEE